MTHIPLILIVQFILLCYHSQMLWKSSKIWILIHIEDLVWIIRWEPFKFSLWLLSNQQTTHFFFSFLYFQIIYLIVFHFPTRLIWHLFDFYDTKNNLILKLLVLCSIFSTIKYFMIFFKTFFFIFDHHDLFMICSFIFF